MFYFKIVNNKKQLDECLNIRKVVFVNEQHIDKEIEFDGLDDTSLHLIAYDENKAIATLRIIRLNEKEVKIGRVAILKEYRNLYIGSTLINFASLYLKEKGYTRIVLGAQLHALKFYKNLGFSQYGDEFLEANIKHIHMQKIL